MTDFGPTELREHADRLRHALENVLILNREMHEDVRTQAIKALTQFSAYTRQQEQDND